VDRIKRNRNVVISCKGWVESVESKYSSLSLLLVVTLKGKASTNGPVSSIENRSWLKHRYANQR
jgi:hypothetical protein